MTAHEWKVLASFGLLLGAISLFDPKTASYVAGVAVAIVVVRNAKKIPLVTDHPATGHPATTMFV